MHDLLYERQQFWSRQSSNLDISAAIDVFRTYAEELGLDLEQYDADVESAEVFDVIDAQTDGGNSLGVTGTPTFFINDDQIPTPRNLEDFRVLLDAEIAAFDEAAAEADEASEEDTSDKEEAVEETSN